MLKLNLLKALGWAALGAAFTNTASAQVKTLSATAKTGAATAVSPVLLSGDSLDEASLVRSLGITEFQVEMEDQLELATLDMEQFASSSSTIYGQTITYTVGTTGPLDGLCPIRTRNRTGAWLQAGSIDLIDLLDATWSLGSGTLEQQVREYLQNARADYYRFRLNGFYDISIHLSDASFATCVVTVSADKKRMQLVYDIPGNQVDCTANLTSPLGWPDRDVRVTTTVRIEVTMDVTGNLASPTRISGFRVSLHDTECWNDGILFRETFNQRVENEVNAVSVPLPLELGQFIFSSVNTNLRTHINANTTKLFFEYAPGARHVGFMLDRNVIAVPVDMFGNTTTIRK